MKKNRLSILLPFFLIIFSSCIGFSADIKMRKDGSGRLVLEYRYSRMAESIGKLDGNERWQIIPAGRADMERTAARIDGMKLVSFTSKEDEKNIINKATLDFNSVQALVKFLDPSGRRANFSGEGGNNRLCIILNDSVNPQTDPQLMELFRSVSEPYRCGISFSAAAGSALSITDGAGNKISTPAKANIVSQGKKVSVSLNTAELLENANGLGVLITW